MNGTCPSCGQRVEVQPLRVYASPRIVVCCGFVWDAKRKCSAWGAPMGSHGCKYEPDHEGGHRCACGKRYEGD